jgi:hypothetical protein
MGYFDALTSYAFKTAPDGRRLFFPWGWFGRGYIIGSGLDYERLRQRIKNYHIVAMVLTIGALALLGLLAGLVVAAAMTLFYFAWTRYLRRGLQPSDETLSLQESIILQARAQSPVRLWIGEIFSIALVAGGILILVSDRGKWPIAIAAIVIFGLGAVASTFMLVLRRRS